MYTIETNQLSMVQITEADWALFERLNQEEDVIRYAFDKPSTEEIRERLARVDAGWQAVTSYSNNARKETSGGTLDLSSD